MACSLQLTGFLHFLSFYTCPVPLFTSSTWPLKQLKFVILKKGNEQIIFQKKIRKHIYIYIYKISHSAIGKNKITDINQHWHGCKEQKILYFVTLALSLWRTCHQHLLKFYMCIPFDLEIPLLGIHPQETYKFTVILIEAFLMIVKEQKQL